MYTVLCLFLIWVKKKFIILNQVSLVKLFQMEHKQSIFKVKQHTRQGNKEHFDWHAWCQLQFSTFVSRLIREKLDRLLGFHDQQIKQQSFVLSQFRS